MTDNDSCGGPTPDTYLHWLAGNLKSYGPRTALIDKSDRLSYAEFGVRLTRAAALLEGSGLSRQQPVCFAMEPSVGYATWLLGSMLAGGVPAPLNTRLAPTEVVAYCQRLDPGLVVVDEAHRHLVEGLGRSGGREIPVLVVRSAQLRDETIAVDESELRRFLDQIRPNDPAIIFPTGGTTGLPKGAYTDHAGLLRWAWNISFNSRRHVHETELYFSPFFHVSLMVGIFAALFSGGASVVERTFDAGDALDTIRKHRVSRLMGAPTMFGALIDHPDGTPENLAGIQDVIFGAAASTEQFVHRMLNGFPNARVATGYGATEFASGVSRVEHQDLVEGRVGGVGRPNPGCQIRIVHPESGVDVAPGELGEVIVRSPWQTLGYWNQPDETKATYRDDGFINLGDLGFLDHSGWLTIAGRTKEMIITGGENVFPSEVEQVFSRFSGVAEVVVFGVPDERWGERVEAVIRPLPGCEVDAETMRSEARSSLGGYKIPKRVHVIDTIPLTPNNKPDRRALSARFSDVGMVN